MLPIILTLASLATPQFEVASVKISRSPDATSRVSRTPGRYTATNVPLRFIILDAYRLMDHQLVGAPEWISSTSFDIAATYPPGGAPTEPEVRLMVQTLLKDRFGLTVHTDQRELPAYGPILARKDGRLGPQLRTSDAVCQPGKQPACTMIATRRFVKGTSRTMSQLSAALQSLVGRPVVDRTGLTGTFDIDLQWAPSDVGVAPPINASPNDGPSIFTALQEQLGLKLDPRRERFEVLVVDRVERPTEN